MAILKNTAGQKVSVLAINSTTGSPVTGLSGADIVFFYSIDGATPALCGNQFVEIGSGGAPGLYSLPLRQLETNGDMIMITGIAAVGTTSIDPTAIYTTVDPPTLSNQNQIISDIAALNDFNPATDAVANVTLVGTTSVNTDMRGTDGANTVAPVDVSADVTAILADTNELQQNQGQWLTATGFSTFNPATDTVATVTTVTNTPTDMLTATVYTASLPSNFGIMSINGSGEITTSNPAAGGGSAHTAADVRDLILSGDKTPITTATNAVSNVVLVATTTDLTNGGGGGGDASESNQLAIQVTVDNIESKLVRRR